MTEILTWNIQCGLGVDGRVDLDRIAAIIRSMGDANVICLQEVCRHMPELDGGAGSDQASLLAGLFPDHEPYFGAGPDRIAGRGRGDERASFGNMILSRLPVLSVFRHPMPQPAAAGIKHMPRQATEVTVATPTGPLRVVTTHLEYHARAHRLAQIERLRALHFEAAANVMHPPAQAGGPYEPLERPVEMVLCGDFNFDPKGAEYAGLLAPFDDGVPALSDGWRAVHGERPHEPTCGVHDHKQWPQGKHCRDFFFVTPDVRARATAIHVNVDTNASDHQPLLLTLSD
ncbi:MAG: endonuclease/exonuclease/phosphatase family protein [Hyphomicrobiaceae bacterium]